MVYESFSVKVAVNRAKASTYKYRIPGTTDNLNGRMEYVNYS